MDTTIIRCQEKLTFRRNGGGVNTVEPYSFRFYSHYVTDPNIIVSEGIAHLQIENVLNSRRHNEFYSDKNSYDLFLVDINRPRTLLRRNGYDYLMNEQYEVIANCKDDSFDFKKQLGCSPAIIVKPSVDSCSGIGVEKFALVDGEYKAAKGDVLTLDYLRSKYPYFIIQSCVEQSPFISSFCSTAINTLRLCVYKSVLNGDWKVTASVLRVGKEGNVVDNAHAGGGMVKINLSSGKLGNKLMFSNGKSVTQWNNIDFSNSSFTIPNWDSVKAFALRIAQKYYGFHLIALDICLDKDNTPVLIEVNTNQFSFWIPLYFNFDVFGGELDEVLKRCGIKDNSINLK
ncbi:hypothetical protein EAJ10_24665 [Bacteroides thetaiotaomicron]|uniref:Alpha-L-glutamate ligase-related protein ATP-grasp domain-containing protein n=1 Tax=Bacteroides thetaiotaomicron TaxID=818 RepID=A0A7J5JBN8_BACT4|nr:sugar-transfer associated ATP-grasp domain-containing protein [Bacteroides thetaiotaomicron]KAB4413986.1 hypothetical protein GAN94_23540 [Bacteroides thetaiotaomicron]KAB4428663.1 hypothetical protein GAN87_24355 [Bacteroides thetaiotaomicron]KAB4435382.1 hypothetical protein GAN99_24595 [Bacteroides thetaiotaomicron]KAB4447932.1 hypothetical protein GAN93_23080 [Bacteroides thetaiotaomicron]RYT13233.1 hypothetical protein EAJ10_24665 [Bacteroides thetaiotaomicron]